MSLYDDATGIWHFNNSPVDSKGGYDAVFTGATYDGSIKKLGSHAADCDGINDDIGIANNAVFEVQVFTWSIWHYVASLATQNWINVQEAASKGHLLWQESDDNYYWRVRLNTTQSAPVSLGWNHIVCSFDENANQKFYVNGVLKASNAALTFIRWPNIDIKIGLLGANYKKAKVDELNYWQKVLTDGGVSVGQTAGGEIAELWNGGSGIELGLVSKDVRRLLLLLNRKRDTKRQGRK